MIKSQKKAFITTGFFCLTLLISIFWNKIQWQISLPLVIFYLSLIFNTFFSIKTFSSLIPKNNIYQNMLDSIIFIFYIILAFTITDALLFTGAVILLFSLATLKYPPLLSLLPYPQLLKRKIIIDISGIALGLVTLGGILMGYSYYASWSLAIVFSIASICLLFIWPMYRIDELETKKLD